MDLTERNVGEVLARIIADPKASSGHLVISQNWRDQVCPTQPEDEVVSYL